MESWFKMAGTGRHAFGITIVIPIVSCYLASLPDATLHLCVTLLPKSTDIDKVATSKINSFFYSFFTVWWINPACWVKRSVVGEFLRILENSGI
jgi:hypothetical protein